MWGLRAQDAGGGLEQPEQTGLAPGSSYWVSPLLLLLWIHVPGAQFRKVKSSDAIAGTELSFVGSKAQLLKSYVFPKPVRARIAQDTPEFKT